MAVTLSDKKFYEAVAAKVSWPPDVEVAELIDQLFKCFRYWDRIGGGRCTGLKVYRASIEVRGRWRVVAA